MTQQKTYSTARKVVSTLFLALTVLFIFYNSSKDGAASGNISIHAMNLINGGLRRLGFSFQVSHLLVRKLGHLAEYAMLGFWLVLVLRVYTRRVIAHVAWPLLGGLLVAVSDEFYQTFIPGRSGQVRDVVIDFFGVCCGVAAAMVLALLFNALQNRRRHRRIAAAVAAPTAPAGRGRKSS